MTTLFVSGWDNEDIVTSVLTVLTGVIAFYVGFFKPTGITEVIENGTSPGGGSKPPEPAPEPGTGYPTGPTGP